MEPTNKEPTFCYLVMNELRCLDYINNLYEYIIDYYDADIIICCQDLPGKQSDIELFDRKVVYKEKYTKPDPYEWYAGCSSVRVHSNNWNIPACLQLYINMDKMADVVEKFKDKYDYFIMTRTDIKIIFPYPDKHFFGKIPPGMYSYDAHYARIWGGFHEYGFVHKDLIIPALRTANYLIKNVINQQDVSSYNGERFTAFCLNHANIKKNYINGLNFYFIAHDENTHTSWGMIKFYPPANCYVKYTTSVDEVNHNNSLWEKGYRWSFDSKLNCFNLTLPPVIPTLL